MPTDTLSLSVSSPTVGGGRKTARSVSISSLIVPIELENNCSEEGVTIESDDVALTNAIRKHFLEHFGHRDLDGAVSDYSPDAIIIQVVNGGERTKHHGHDEIRKFFEGVFKLHPAGESSFQLEHITVEQKHCMAVWSAKTPTVVITQGSDTFVFNSEGKIIKQFFSCQTHEREDPGTAGVTRKDDKEYGEFFANE